MEVLGPKSSTKSPRSSTEAATTTTSQSLSAANDSGSLVVVEGEEPVTMAAAARVPEDEEEEEDEYEYEYEDDDAFVSGFIDNPSVDVTEEKPVKIEEEWREPSRQAVNMSLRAETETTGSKRRLAQDLYRIMNQDTEAAGFDLEPVEDDMGKWKIRVFQFDADSNLAKDMMVLRVPHIELEMTFPDQYPFEPPFVRVVRPRFKKQTGFVMNGALCMELLTKDGWNPINDIESVIVSIRSLLVVGDGRLEAAANLSEKKYSALLAAAQQDCPGLSTKRLRTNSSGDSAKAGVDDGASFTVEGGSYSVSEAKAAYSHLSEYHKKKGWDTSGWWARKG